MNVVDYADILEDTTINYTQWKEQNGSNINRTDLCVPDAAIFLAPRIAAFMDGPVALYKGQAIEAISMRVNDLEQFLTELKINHEKIVLYKVLWVAPQPLFETIREEDSDKIVDCKYKGQTDGFWIIRAHLDRSKE